MATREGRQQALEQMTIEQLEEFHSTKWGGRWFDKGDQAKSIASLLRTSTRDDRDDDLDQALGLPTNKEQQLQLQRDGVAAAKSSGRAAWISAGCALLALIISVIAIWVAVATN